MIKTKIKNLRSVYHAEVRKINSSKRSGAGAAGVYKPPMPWFSEMELIMADTDNYRETVESDLVESDKSTQNSQTAYANITSSPTPPTSTSTPPFTQTEKSRSSDDYLGRRKKVKKIEETDGVAEALNRSQNISSAINNRSEEDEFHFFGLNVASQLRQLPLYEALGVQTEIQAILTMARRRNMYPDLSAHIQSN
ncbi:unnamed protein product [Parnassius apollo]|uniref:(apollo) hypothetical protein n=1 Tax=Parnassius apollo TaxID=110799 RepID=A0A8S3YDX6_PARAO|nr:unnamed protein product [Parnassius apollo]